MFKELKHNAEVDAAAYLLSERKFEALIRGNEINEQGEEVSLFDELMNTRSAATDARCKYISANRMLKYHKEKLKDAEKQLKTTNPGEEKEEMAQLQKEIKSLQVSHRRISKTKLLIYVTNFNFSSAYSVKFQN